MRAIVSGATGYIGRNLTKQLVDNGYVVTAIVRSSSDTSALPRGTDIAVCDKTDAMSLVNALRGKEYDCFYDLAWPGSSGDNRARPDLQIDSARASIERSRAAVDIGCKRFLFVGSVAQYYVSRNLNTNGTKPSAKDYYGVSKRYAENMSKIICSEGGVDHLAVHLSSTYGDNATAGFVYHLIKGMLNNEPILLTDKETFSDLIHVSDVASGIRLAGEKGVAFSSYFIGSGEPRTIEEYVNIAKEIIESDSKIMFGAIQSQGDLTAKDLSIERLKKDTGYDPKIRFAAGLRSTLDQMR